MKIAFDLDGTLIPIPGSTMQTERLSLLSRTVSREQLRTGAPALLRNLRRRGHEVWIYTTSMRSPLKLRLWFLTFGVPLHGIVNHATHYERLGKQALACSKFPPAFGIDLLIDDAEGVVLEGKRFGFSMLHIREDDSAWCAAVEAAVFGRVISSPRVPREVDAQNASGDGTSPQF
jgi:hypothetical protein